LLCVTLTFRGDPPGRFGALLSGPVARTLAADFLRMEPDALTPVQIFEVAGELANIVCGGVLSELEANANFSISSPVMDHADSSPQVGCRFELPGGEILFLLTFGAAA